MCKRKSEKSESAANATHVHHKSAWNFFAQRSTLALFTNSMSDHKVIRLRDAPKDFTEHQ